MALAEVHWARGVLAPIPQINEPSIQENHIIEAHKEEECAVSKQKTAARRNGEDGTSDTFIGYLHR
jgi:hypothetical protein